jgi:uncharacterized membrane protein YqhA
MIGVRKYLILFRDQFLFLEQNVDLSNISSILSQVDVWYVYVFILFVLSCVYVEAMQRADHSSKEFYHM